MAGSSQSDVGLNEGRGRGDEEVESRLLGQGSLSEVGGEQRVEPRMTLRFLAWAAVCMRVVITDESTGGTEVAREKGMSSVLDVMSLR